VELELSQALRQELQVQLVPRFQSLELQLIMQAVEVEEVGLTTPTVDLVEQVVVDAVESQDQTLESQELQTLVEVVAQVQFPVQQVAQVDLEL
jgi:hypothetical protein